MNDPELRAELEEELDDNDMETDGDDNEDSAHPPDKDQEFEVDID
jgi:hypothetical protein